MEQLEEIYRIYQVSENRQNKRDKGINYDLIEIHIIIKNLLTIIPLKDRQLR